MRQSIYLQEMLKTATFWCVCFNLQEIDLCALYMYNLYYTNFTYLSCQTTASKLFAKIFTKIRDCLPSPETDSQFTYKTLG